MHAIKTLKMNRGYIVCYGKQKVVGYDQRDEKAEFLKYIKGAPYSVPLRRGIPLALAVSIVLYVSA